MVLLACAFIVASPPGLIAASTGTRAEPVMGVPQIAVLPVATSLLAASASPAAPGAGDSVTAPVVAPMAVKAPAPPGAADSARAPTAPLPTATSPAAGTGNAPPVSAAAGDIAPPRDPWEHTNRAIFSFDTSIDRHLVGPVSRGYSATLPFVLRHHISLAVANLDAPITIANDLLQLRMGAFGKSLARFTLNSTFGIGGLFDFASHHKLGNSPADFGQTLGRWGAKPGPYVMLPLLGPSNLRDGIGRAVDLIGDPVSWLLGGITTTFGGSRQVVSVVDNRAQAEPAVRAVYDSIDPYAAARSGYMQSRADIVRDATGTSEALPEFDAQ